MALSALQIKSLSAKRRPYKVTDEKGMYLHVMPTGSKIFRLDYRFGGKRRTLTLGGLNLISLAEARERRDAARKQLLDGLDPAEVKAKAKKESDVPPNAFRHIAKEWYDHRKKTISANYMEDQWGRLERLVFPRIGDTPITDLRPKDALRIFHRIEARGTPETAHRTLQLIGQVFRLAIVKGHVEFDITASLRGQLPPIPRDIPRASVPLAELPALLRAIDGYEDAWPVTRLALKTVSLTLLRFQEFGHATWDEIEGLDGEAPLWRVPEARMKMKRPHVVPLSPQAVAVLRELQKVSGDSGFMFPSPHRVWQPLTNNALIFALYRLGYRTRQTIHGWRHIASTVLNEQGFNPDWIERQLAHEEQKKSRRAYNAAQYLEGRRTMLAWWADFLDKQRGLIGAGSFPC